jgi:lysozyme
VRSSQRIIDMIKGWEGFRAEPYLCPGRVWTIGFGTTRYPNGVFVGEQDPEITRGQAEQYLRHDLIQFERAVLKNVKVEISQNQFDALVSFTYNVGPGNLKTSTLLKLLNTGKYLLAAQEFPKWNKAGGKVLPGLVKRRKEEMDLFLTPY